jgi:hypothetical protein
MAAQRLPTAGEGDRELGSDQAVLPYATPTALSAPRSLTAFSVWTNGSKRMAGRAWTLHRNRTLNELERWLPQVVRVVRVA